jgi:hypothetical protein
MSSTLDLRTATLRLNVNGAFTWEVPLAEGPAANQPDDGNSPVPLQHGAFHDEHVPGLHWKRGELPGWLRRTTGENRWPVTIGLLIAIGLQIALPALRPATAPAAALSGRRDAAGPHHR